MSLLIILQLEQRKEKQKGEERKKRVRARGRRRKGRREDLGFSLHVRLLYSIFHQFSFPFQWYYLYKLIHPPPHFAIFEFQAKHGQSLNNFFCMCLLKLGVEVWRQGSTQGLLSKLHCELELHRWWIVAGFELEQRRSCCFRAVRVLIRGFVRVFGSVTSSFGPTFGFRQLGEFYSRLGVFRYSEHISFWSLCENLTFETIIESVNRFT